MTEDMNSREGERDRDCRVRLIRAVRCSQEDAGIEAQPFEGERAGSDIDSWGHLETEAAEAQANGPGLFDDLVAGDAGNTDRPVHPADWNGPPDAMERGN